MADEDGYGGGRRHDEEGLGRLLNLVKSLQRDVAELKRGAPLRAAGISASPDGLTVNSSLDVQGELSATGDTEIGGNLDITGNTDIGGSLDVTGEAILRSQGSLTLLGTLYINRDGVPDLPGYLHAFEGASGRTVMRLVPPRQDDSSETLLYIEGATPGFDGMIQLISDGQANMKAGSSAFVTAQDSVSITAGSSAFVTGGVVGFRSPNGSGGWAVDVHSNGDKFNATADNGFSLSTPNNSHRIQVIGPDIGVDAPDRLYVAADLHTTGDLSCAGTKPFIIDHPTKPDRSLVHVATESDKAVVEYHYRATIGDDGSATIDLPDYFEALTAPDSRGVQVTAAGRPFMVGAEEPADGQVVVYGDPGRDVFVRVNARRGDDAGQFEVEIPRIQPPHDYEEGPS